MGENNDAFQYLNGMSYTGPCGYTIRGPVQRVLTLSKYHMKNCHMCAFSKRGESHNIDLSMGKRNHKMTKFFKRQELERVKHIEPLIKKILVK